MSMKDLFHIHWYTTVKETRAGRYKLCKRCGNRTIYHRFLNMAMDYQWIKTGKFSGYGEVKVRNGKTWVTAMDDD